MAWRFKASKYKNSAPIVPNFENLVRDLNIGSYRSHGNFIAASAAFVAFNWDIQGSNLAVLPLETKGRQNKATIPLIYAHADFVTDFQFSPFDDGLLATGSQDLTVKLWRIPESGLTETGLNQPELVLPSQPRRVETVNFHPIADCILATTSHDTLVIWDLIQAKELFNFCGHEDEVQSVAWQHSGNLLATQSKDRQLRILDPRSGKTAAQTDSHQGMKDSKVVWINGDSDRLFTTGFSADRLREITMRDLRNLSTPQKNMSLDMSAGILVPLYDPDTNMCFLAGKGDRNVQFIELTDKDPFVIEGLKYSGEQTKGACLVPKRAMDVMQGEVNRVLQLCDNMIVPITWQVPRKSYREYHADIYPETIGLDPACGPEVWWKDGATRAKLSKIDLDPKKRPKEILTVFQGPISQRNPNSIFHSPDQKNGKMQHQEETTTLSSHAAAATNGHPKPNPRPRCVVKASSVVSPSSPPPTTQKPVVSPRGSNLCPSPTNNCRPKLQTSLSTDHHHQNNGDAVNGRDSVDEGLALLRRQHSIRDRKKLFEENIRKQQQQQQCTSGGASNGNNHESNKENIVSAAVPALERQIEKSDTDSLSSSQPLNIQKTEVMDARKNIFLAMDKSEQAVQEEKPAAAAAKRPTSKMFVRVSKFKHLKGEVILKGKFENLKNLSRTVPAECNFIKANSERIAVPLTGPGGKLAIFETSKPGRIPDGVTPVLINGTTVLDFAFDPFDRSRIVAACDDGFIRVWKIPPGGLTSQVNDPISMFPAHGDKVQIVKWHPLAQDILLSVAFDRSAKIWDLNNTDVAKIELEGHTDQIFSAEWSGCGRFVATVCKDGKIRIFEPRVSAEAKLEGGEIVAKKGARVVWVLDGQYLIVTGFSKQSERQVMVYQVSDLELVHSTVLDVSPAILIPHYDEDSSTLFINSKGESTVTTFEVSTESPHLFPLSPYRPSGLHQGFVFLPKNVLSVKDVEFARAYRLTNTTIEPISFTVPRVKAAYFQDDLFPPTRVLWEPTLTAGEWLNGSQKQAKLISLCPEGMPALSGFNNNKATSSQTTTSARPNIAPAAAADVAGSAKIILGAKNSQAESDLEKSVSNLVPVSRKLEQDEMDGVDESEWNDADGQEDEEAIDQ